MTILDVSDSHVVIEDKRQNLISIDFQEDHVTLGVRQEHGDLEYVHLTIEEMRLLAQTIVRWYGVAPAVSPAEEFLRRYEDEPDDE